MSGGKAQKIGERVERDGGGYSAVAAIEELFGNLV